MSTDRVGILKLDFKNAFNSINRSAVLSAIHQQWPELSAYAYSSYGASSNLFFALSILEFSNGVQQGDRPGPLLFAVGTLNAIEALECLLSVKYLVLVFSVTALSVSAAPSTKSLKGSIESLCHAQ